MAEQVKSKLSNATSAMSNFFTTYRTPILITFAVIVVLAVGYYFMGGRNEGFNCGGRGNYMYPGRETMYGPMNSPYEEGFYADQAQPQMQPKGNGMGQKKMILFYAPWCPHCKSLMEGDGSVWQSLARKHHGRPDVSIDQINCDEKPEMATQYGVGGFPTIMLFQGDKTYTYDGDRSLESLERFLESPN
jgi:thiol-disulfide isomerase/thioredoxin